MPGGYLPRSIPDNTVPSKKKQNPGGAPTGAPPGVPTPTGISAPQPLMATVQTPKSPAANNTPAVKGISERLPGITSKNSDLMRRAALYGNQQAARRGLLNSTMGIEASQAAVLDQAVRIAEGDASVGTSNADRTSREALTREGYDHQTSLQDDAQEHQASESLLARLHDTSEREAQQSWQSEENQAGRDHTTSEREGMQDFTSKQNQLNRNLQMNLQNDQQTFQAEQTQLTREHDAQMRELDRELQALSISEGAKNSIRSQFTAQYNAIMSNPDLDEGSRASQIRQAITHMKNQMRMYEENPDGIWQPTTQPTQPTTQPTNPGRYIPNPPGRYIDYEGEPRGLLGNA